MLCLLCASGYLLIKYCDTGQEVRVWALSEHYETTSIREREQWHWSFAFGIRVPMPLAGLVVALSCLDSLRPTSAGASKVTVCRASSICLRFLRKTVSCPGFYARALYWVRRLLGRLFNLRCRRL